MRKLGLLWCLAFLCLPAGALAPASGEPLACQPVVGLEKLLGPKAPAFVLIGESTETREAPAAFAEIACRLARAMEKGDKLLVGVTDYFGGASDAETKMRARLEELAASGAPIVVFSANDGRREDRHARDQSEADWAAAIEEKMAAASAKRVLILLPRSDASLAEVPASPRNAAFRPMPMHLPAGQVASLKIVQSSVAPGIRIYPSLRDGFLGEIAFGELTRPEFARQGPDQKEDYALVRLELPQGATAAEAVVAMRAATLRTCKLSPEERSRETALFEARNEDEVQISPPGAGPGAGQIRFFTANCAVYTYGRTLLEDRVKTIIEERPAAPLTPADQ